MKPKSKNWVYGRIRSFGYAIDGILTTLKEQMNFRIHILIALVVIITGYFVKLTSTEWVVLILTIAMVLSLESLNTVLEHLVDLVSPSIQEKARKAKDAAAGAVLIGAIASVIIGVIIFGPKLLACINKP